MLANYCYPSSTPTRASFQLRGPGPDPRARILCDMPLERYVSTMHFRGTKMRRWFVCPQNQRPEQVRSSAGACESKQPPHWPWCPANIAGRRSYRFPVVPAWTALRRLGVIRRQAPQSHQAVVRRQMRPHAVCLTDPGIPESDLQNDRSAKCQGSAGLILGIS